jgi:hypothetical protein
MTLPDLHRKSRKRSALASHTNVKCTKKCLCILTIIKWTACRLQEVDARQMFTINVLNSGDQKNNGHVGKGKRFGEESTIMPQERQRTASTG